VRVIAGEAKGRRLVAPAGKTTRPATDRVRESIFGTLGERAEDARVLDLFAGSGALGIEALSRGAAAAVFVERDARAAETIRQNLAVTGLGASATVVRADVASFLHQNVEVFDLVFCDPPYEDVDVMAILLAGGDLRRATRGMLVLRALRKHAPPVPEQWNVERERIVGEDLVRYVT
jgi:16S rRNA (guanine966-N2)-methyltransferase